MKQLRSVTAMVAIGTVAIGATAGTVRDGTLPKSDAESFAAFLGDYSGQWRSEVTDNVYDDISRYRLEEPVMRLSMNDDRRVRVTFFMDAEAAKSGEALDLLGFGCHSAVGDLLTFKTTRGGMTASFDFDWGQCPSRVYAVKSNDLALEIVGDREKREYVAHVTLLKSIKPDDKVYATTKTEGKREVKVRPKAGDSRLYNAELEYCVVDDLGETQACFARESEVKKYLVPFPFPGLTALWYTKKTPALTVEHGTKREYHEADFRRAMP